MKTIRQILFTITAMLTCAASAQPANFSNWQGVWTGTLDGQPGVILTLADDDAGQLGGTAVFNMVAHEKGDPPQVIGHSIHLLQHLQPIGDTLTFEVVRRTDHKQLDFALKLNGDAKGELRCTNCDSPVTELVRSR